MILVCIFHAGCSKVGEWASNFWPDRDDPVIQNGHNQSRCRFNRSAA